MTDAECQEAMDKGEKVLYFGRNSKFHGQSGLLIRRDVLYKVVRWSIDLGAMGTFRCTADLFQQVAAASPLAPMLAPLAAFQVGDCVIYVNPNNPAGIPFGSQGTITKVMYHGMKVSNMTYEVDFPTYPFAPGVPWVISHQELQHDFAPPPAVPLTHGAPLAKASSITVGPPTWVTIAGGAVLARDVEGHSHRPQSAAPPRPIAHHPHACPRCKGPAYIGFSTIECADKACR